MKKEKTVKTHTRKLKSGKQVTVKQHTASYDAADVVADVLKKKGAGGELEQLKKKKAIKPEPVEKEDIYSEYGFTKDEFAEWYEGTGSKADKKVEKILRKAMGRKAYNELSDSAADNYRKGGANSFFKKSIKAMKETTSSDSSKKGGFDNSKSFKANFPKELHKYLDAGDFCLKKKPTKEVTRAFKAAGFDIKYNPVEGLYEPVDSKTGLLYGEKTAEQVKRDHAERMAKIRSEQADVIAWAKAHDYVVLRSGNGFVPRSEYRKRNWESVSADELRKKMKAEKTSEGTNWIEKMRAARERITQWTPYTKAWYEAVKKEGYRAIKRKLPHGADYGEYMSADGTHVIRVHPDGRQTWAPEVNDGRVKNNWVENMLEVADKLKNPKGAEPYLIKHGYKHTKREKGKTRLLSPDGTHIVEISKDGGINWALANGLKEKSTPKTTGAKSSPKLTAAQNRLISSQDQTDKLPKSFGEFAGKRIESLMTDKGTFAAKFRREYPEFCKAYSAEYKRRRTERETKQAARPTKRYKKDYELGPDGETRIVHKEVTPTRPPKRNTEETEESSMPPKRVPISGPQLAIQRRRRIERLEEESQLRRSIEELTKSRDKHHRGSIGYGEINREIVALRRRLNKIKKY